MNEHKRNMILGVVILLAVGLFLYVLLDRKIDRKVRHHHDTRMMMGTYVRVDACFEPEQQVDLVVAFTELWYKLERIEKLMSVYKPKSDIVRINEAGGQEVRIDPLTYNLIQDSFIYNDKTHGAFDITVKPLSILWKMAGVGGQAPSEQALQEAQNSIGKINFDLLGRGLIRRINSASMLDLGGIAKGYAVDEVAKSLDKYKFKNYMVDAGGDIYASGKNCQGQPWRIGVRDPRDSNAIIDVLAVEDMAVTTSGDYEQFVEINGKRYSHIIDPSTGYPADKVVSATVIAPTAKEGDVYATALCVLGARRGKQFIDELGAGYAALMIEIDDAGELKKTTTKAYSKYVQP